MLVRRHPALAVLALLASVALPLAASAQTATPSPDSLPFHAGQWGAEFVIAYSFGGLGALRFHSPRAAWTINVSGGASRDKDLNRSRDGSNDGTASTSGGSLRLGYRWYRPLARSVAAYVGTGLTASTTRSKLDQRDYTNAQTSNLIGPFGNVGGTYFVSPHLGLSGGIGLDAGYRRESSSINDTVSDSRRRSSGYFVQLGSTTLIASLYF